MVSLPREIRSVPGPGLEAMRAVARNARLAPLYEVERGLDEIFGELSLGFVGAGSVGLALAQRLAPLAPRQVVIVDPALLKETSPLTHPCHPLDIGRPKAVVAGELFKALSPRTRVFVYEGCVEDLSVHVLAGLDCVLMATDHVGVEVAVGQRALQLGFDLIQGSLFGGTLSAQVRVFATSGDGQDGKGAPCPYDVLSAPELAELDRGTVFSCEGGPLEAPAPDRSRLPTRSPAFLCSIAADLVAVELTRRQCGIADRRESHLLEYCGYTHRVTSTPLVRREGCPQDHVRMRLEPLGDTSIETPGALMQRAGVEEAALERTRLEIDGHRFASLASCACPRHPRLGRFLPDDAAARRCDVCREVLSAHPLHVHRRVPGRALAPHLDRSLVELGAGAARVVRVHGEGQPVLFHRPFPEPCAPAPRSFQSTSPDPGSP